MSSFGRTGIMPVKDPHTRIKPLALASGHSRYITVAPERTLVSVGKWPYSRYKFLTVSEVKPPPGSRSGASRKLETQ
jgi:hypothetical protein